MLGYRGGIEYALNAHLGSTSRDGLLASIAWTDAHNPFLESPSDQPFHALRKMQLLRTAFCPFFAVSRPVHTLEVLSLWPERLPNLLVGGKLALHQHPTL
jgi:hypothetical protein